ncbi:hypothetical protein BD626DRAFT_472035 [Schizophyllum amplum]|uniref:Uncharacterized protein n=1 Tax=Schizophyllum amplum TaxID=97359 RepID=A0A550CVK7_9AGAR|nr:hypothetical protein BD626DRAFT_472035 [Auriculariopsis ampla]
MSEHHGNDDDRSPSRKRSRSPSNNHDGGSPPKRRTPTPPHRCAGVVPSNADPAPSIDFSRSHHTPSGPRNPRSPRSHPRRHHHPIDTPAAAESSALGVHTEQGFARASRSSSPQFAYNVPTSTSLDGPPQHLPSTYTHLDTQLGDQYGVPVSPRTILPHHDHHLNPHDIARALPPPPPLGSLFDGYIQHKEENTASPVRPFTTIIVDNTRAPRPHNWSTGPAGPSSAPLQYVQHGPFGSMRRVDTPVHGRRQPPFVPSQLHLPPPLPLLPATGDDQQYHDSAESHHASSSLRPAPRREQYYHMPPADATASWEVDGALPGSDAPDANSEDDLLAAAFAQNVSDAARRYARQYRQQRHDLARTHSTEASRYRELLSQRDAELADVERENDYLRYDLEQAQGQLRAAQDDTTNARSAASNERNRFVEARGEVQILQAQLQAMRRQLETTQNVLRYTEAQRDDANQRASDLTEGNHYLRALLAEATGEGGRIPEADREPEEAALDGERSSASPSSAEQPSSPTPRRASRAVASTRAFMNPNPSNFRFRTQALSAYDERAADDAQSEDGDVFQEEDGDDEEAIAAGEEDDLAAGEEDDLAGDEDDELKYDEEDDVEVKVEEQENVLATLRRSQSPRTREHSRL